jgi:hypothetical protein
MKNNRGSVVAEESVPDSLEELQKHSDVIEKIASSDSPDSHVHQILLALINDEPINQTDIDTLLEE